MKRGELPSRKSVTLSDVAARAGVSTMTASKVLRQTGSISQETRAKVRQAADDLGYVPNRLARSLSSQTSTLIGVIIPSIGDAIFGEVVSGINEVIRPAGFQTFIGETFFDPEIEAETIRTMLSFQPAGMLVTGGSPYTEKTGTYLAAQGCPGVSLWDLRQSGFDYCVGPSHGEAGRLAAEHLMIGGRTKLGYVGAELDLDLCAARRKAAFCETALAHGASVTEQIGAQMPRRFPSGAALTEELLTQAPDVEAIYYLNDAMAIGGLSWLHQQGMSVPERVAVCGFNGSSANASVQTCLTTVDVPRREIGVVAAQALLKLLKAEDPGPNWTSRLTLVAGNTS